MSGRESRPARLTPDGRETHLDRALDIAFSGLVFRKGCGPTFFGTMLPLIAATPAPSCVVDVGCGDGTLLLELGRAMRQHGLSHRPLVLVGIDPAPEARDETQRRLAAEGLPHRVLGGDIADPAAIAAALESHGIALREGLFVSKSVFHDRRFQPPAAETPRPRGEPPSTVYLAEDGSLLAAEAVERHLIEVLQRWRPWIGPHGMLVIEAHTASPALGARTAGRHILVPLEITHGLSHQYLTEAARFRSLVTQAGFRVLARHDLNTWLVGAPLMTLDLYGVDEHA